MRQLYKQFTQALPGPTSENLVRAQRFFMVHRTILGEWLPGVRNLEVKMYVKSAVGTRKVSAVRS